MAFTLTCSLTHLRIHHKLVLEALETSMFSYYLRMGWIRFTIVLHVWDIMRVMGSICIVGSQLAISNCVNHPFGLWRPTERTSNMCHSSDLLHWPTMLLYPIV